MFLLIFFIFTSDTQSKVQDKPNCLNNMLMNAALCSCTESVKLSWEDSLRMTCMTK
jgi:hypothetical protein